MAPEILRSEKYDDSSDLWSVGCILYQCLVGRAPFVVSTHYELIKKLEKEDAVVPPDIRAQISEDCFALIMRLLDKNRDTRIGWEAFFRHPWFGVAAASSSNAGVGSVEMSYSSSSSGGSQRDRAPHWTMESAGAGAALTPGAIIARHEAVGRKHRVVDRALAVLELADMKTDHGKREEAAVLYRKGLECLTSAMASLRRDSSSDEGGGGASVSKDDGQFESLMDRLRVKMRIYQERSTRAVSSRSSRHSLQPRAPSELLLEFALQMGRDGGVSEILGDFAKAEKLYSNGCVILEQLLSMTPHASDKVFLTDALQRFVQRIVFVNQRLEEENQHSD